MGVHIDPARCDDHAGGINLFLAAAADLADLADQAVVDCNIPRKTRCARAVDDRSAANNHIMHGRLSSSKVGKRLSH